MISYRTLIAALLVTGALAAVLLGWYGSGWRAVEREERALVMAARAEAEDSAAELAASLAAALEQLRVDESARPYFHYQNLFHDPRGASESPSVAPSPLASGPGDPLVAVHFQIDGAGAITSPTDNAWVPETANPAAVDRVVLADLGRIKPELMQPPDPVQVAMATPLAPVVPDPKTASIDGKRDPEKGPLFDDKPRPKSSKARAQVKEPEPQVVVLDPDAYAQNRQANDVFVKAKNAKRAPPAPSQDVMQQPQAVAPIEQVPQALELPDELPPPPDQSTATAPASRRRPPSPRPVPTAVTITVSPLAWRATTVGGQPAMVAVRRVTTPDGTLTQGLVVSARQARVWLADRAPEASLLTAAPADPAAAHIAAAQLPLGGAAWWVGLDDRSGQAAAARAGAALERGFLGRFIPIAILAAVCAALVVALTAHAEQLARQRARFAAAAAHELRTPLAGIQLYGDMLVDGLGDPTKKQDYARRVAEEASRLGRVVANVLGFSQLERRSLAVRAEPGDLVAAVQGVIERAEPGLTRAGATVELAAPATVTARFDRDALTRIVGNLLDNADKYSRDHADRRITVRVRAVGTSAEVEVIDRGPGLPASMRRRRFRPFARGTGDDGPPGLGLGLALSQSLARAMGGDLAWRDQSPGAAFVLTLPAGSRH